MQFQTTFRRSLGFSLVELSVVLVIIGALLGIVISGLTTFSQNTANTATRSKQVAIQESLLSYLRANGRLPCPDTGPSGVLVITPANLPDGIENRADDGPPINTASNCLRAWGAVPYTTLGLPREAALDHWGNFLTYVVSNNLAPAAPLNPTPTRDWVISNNFRSGSLGDLEVLDGAGGVTQAAAVLISHGIGGSGAFTTKGTQIVAPVGAHEIANASGCPRGATGLLQCYKRDFTDNSASVGGAFDDLVHIITPADLQGPLFAQSVKYPPSAEFQRRCTEIRDTLTSVGLTNRAGITPTINYDITPVVTAYSITNPYGGVLTCTISANFAISASTPNASLCNFISLGLDGAAGGNDDLTCLITVDELRALFARTGF